MRKIVEFKVGSAITVLNAIKAPRGSAIGTRLFTTAEVTGGAGIHTGEADTLLVERCMELLDAEDLRVEIRTPLPLARGLKTSSSVSLAVLGAISVFKGMDLISEDLVSLSARASRDIGVSVTGAADDAYACLLGGWVVTDTSTQRLVRRIEVSSIPLIILVPKGQNKKSGITDKLRSLDQHKIEEALTFIDQEDYISCIRANTEAYAPALGDYNLIKQIQPLADVVGLNGAGPSIFLLNPHVSIDTIRTQAPKYDIFLTSTR